MIERICFYLIIFSQKRKGKRETHSRRGSSLAPIRVSQPICGMRACWSVVFSIIWWERSARMAFFDMRTCPHIGPKCACRRPGTKYCVDLFFYFRTLWNTPPLMLLFLPLLQIPKQLKFLPLGRDLRPNMFIESEERTRGETSSTTRIALVP